MEVAITDFLTTTINLHHTVGDIQDQHFSTTEQSTGSAVLDTTHWAQVLNELIHRLTLPVSLAAPDDDPSDKAVQATQKLSRECCKVARDLLIRLDRIEHITTNQKANEPRNLDIQTIWPKEDVEALAHRLHDLAQQWVELCPPDVKTSALAMATRMDNVTAPDRQKLRQKGKLDQDLTLNSSNNSKDSTSTTGKRPVQASATLLQDFILENLSYKSMRDREEEVAEAHKSTFDWIFTNATDTASETAGDLRDPFIKWLNSDELGSIYWINGKPGSGKSTLMRYLYEHKSTVQLLQSWAHKQPLAKAGFFFWTSGSQEQRSQTGLLRYLLHQLLSKYPVLISITFPDLWQKLLTMSTKERIKLSFAWTASELIDAFHLFLDAALPAMKICLFVDGLDEFDGDHNEIINFFKDISEKKLGHRIKMCLSSRPWEVFEKAFEYSVPNLKLQDLTYDDMYHYVWDNLKNDVRVRRLLKKEPAAAEELVKDTVQRANGIFLWVRLSVRKMLEKFKAEDTIADIQTFLETLPTDLDTLFEQLLFRNQSPTRFAETANIFRLIRAREIVVDFIKDESANSLTLWEMAFALNQEDDHFVVGVPVQEATDEQILQRCQKAKDHILDRSAGLLEIYAKPTPGNLQRARFTREGDLGQDPRVLAGNKVTYLHRTIRDYLMYSEGVWERLLAHSQSDENNSFDPNLRLLRSYVLRLKLPLEEIEHHRRLDDWWPDIALTLTHARYIEQDPQKLQQEFLNELNETLSWFWIPRSNDPMDHWARNAFGSFELRASFLFYEPFLSLATKFGLTDYVEAELKTFSVPSTDIKYTPLLAYATEFLCSRQKTIYPLSSPKLVSILLSHHSQSVNVEYMDFARRIRGTPWVTVIRHLRDARRRGWIEYYDTDEEGTRRWSEIVRMFLEIGKADIDAVAKADQFDPEVTAKEVIDMLDETYGAWEVAQLKSYLMERQSRSGEN